MRTVYRIIPADYETIGWMLPHRKSNPFCWLTKEFIAATGTATSASNSLLKVDTISCTGVEIPDIAKTVTLAIYCTLSPMWIWRSWELQCLSPLRYLSDLRHMRGGFDAKWSCRNVRTWWSCNETHRQNPASFPVPLLICLSEIVKESCAG